MNRHYLNNTGFYKLAQSIKDYVNRKITPNKVLKTGYYDLGASLGCPTGYLLRGTVPKKIVAIGNSLTGIPKSYTLQNGTVVNESRELGASYPRNGWTNLVKKWLEEMYPREHIKFYKALGKTWEEGTLGSRSVDLLFNNDVYEVQSDISSLTSMKVSDVLTSDVDVIIVGLGENITGIDSSNWKTLANDYLSLFCSLRELCPTATIYNFGLFWSNHYKQLALSRASLGRYTVNHSTFEVKEIPFVQTIYNTGWSGAGVQIAAGGGFDRNSLLCQEGDGVYAQNGEQVGSIPAVAAGHPNDIGYLNYAIMVIFNLMWLQGNHIRHFDASSSCRYISKPVLYNLNFNTDNVTVQQLDIWLDACTPTDGIYLVGCRIPASYSESVIPTDKTCYGVLTIATEVTREVAIELAPFTTYKQNATLSAIKKCWSSLFGDMSFAEYLQNKNS